VYWLGPGELLIAFPQYRLQRVAVHGGGDRGINFLLPDYYVVSCEMHDRPEYQETTQKATEAAAAPAATSAIFPDLTLETIIYLSMSASRVTTH